MADVCERIGLLPNVVERYVDAAEEYLAKGHLPPVDISPDDLKAAMRDVKKSAGDVCTVPGIAAQAAAVVGFVEEVVSIDRDLSPADRRWRTHQSQQHFDALVRIATTARGVWGARLPQLERDVVLITDEQFGDHDWARLSVPADQPKILHAVLQRVQQTVAKGETPVVVVDLDDTALNPAPRTLRILKEFARQNPAILTPHELSTIELLTPGQLGYSSTADLQARWRIANKTYLEGAQNYWWTKFFTNDYAVTDGAYPGSAAYVTSLKNAGATIVYLTGRHLGGNRKNVAPGAEPAVEAGMRDGTLQSLAQNGLPVPYGKRVRLIMKPQFQTSDVEYKQGLLKEIEALGVPVAVFDNEPKIDNMFVTNWPDATIVRVGRCRAPNPEKVTNQDGSQRPALLQDMPRVNPSVVWVQDFRTKQDTTAQH